MAVTAGIVVLQWFSFAIIIVVANPLGSGVELTGQGRVEDIVHQGRLAGTRDAGNGA